MNAYTREDYYQQYLDEKNVSLDTHFEISPLELKLDIPYKDIIDWSTDNIDKALHKYYNPRPFTTPDNMKQAVLLMHTGYNESNSMEKNWGCEPEDDLKLKEMLGDEFFDSINLIKDKSAVRLLRYDPGHGIPLHTDAFGSFRLRFPEGVAKRYFVAVSPWDWGHFLQLHDNMIHHWEPGYTIEIPQNIFHLSGNCGINPKYTLTVTGIVK